MLLYIEEMQNEIEIIKYTIPKTPMYFQSKDKNGIYLELEVIFIFYFSLLFILFIIFVTYIYIYF